MRRLGIAAIFVLMIGIISISGCIGQNTGQNLGSGIAVRYAVNPSTIYEKGQAVIYMDVENVDIAAVDASVDIFNTGSFSYVDREKCKAEYKNFLPNEIKSMECRLTAPDEIPKQTTTNIDYKVNLDKQFSAPLSFDMIGEGMYIEEEKAGTLRFGQQSYGFSDPNMAVSVEFSKQPPFIMRSGEKVLMYVKIRSLGPGFLSDIEEGMFQLMLQNEADKNVRFDCDFPVEEVKNYAELRERLTAIKGEFPAITCELNVAEVYSKLTLAQAKNYLRSFMLIIKYNYKYEIRGTIPLVVNK
ncbi:MAG: hypothetical protein V1870_04035 [Candidatus Aenigmatarchaeota archaeon]